MGEETMSCYITRSVRWSFTPVELLVVIGILAVLLGLLLPAVLRIHDVANRISYQNRLKQIGLAVLNHESTYGFLPSAGLGSGWIGDPELQSRQHRASTGLHSGFRPCYSATPRRPRGQ